MTVTYTGELSAVQLRNVTFLKDVPVVITDPDFLESLSKKPNFKLEDK